ncbi:hypothetical protein RYX36_006811 [Vicia faba]
METQSPPPPPVATATAADVSQGSPIMYRRLFYDKNDLTKEEIDEAFHCVPDTAPTVQTNGGNQDGQLKSSSNIHQQAQQQTLQPVLPVRVMTASGAGAVLIIKNSLLPRLKSWIRKVVLDNDDELSKETDNKLTLAEEVIV